MLELWLILPILAGIILGYTIIRHDTLQSKISVKPASCHLRGQRGVTFGKTVIRDEKKTTNTLHTSTPQITSLKRAVKVFIK